MQQAYAQQGMPQQPQYRDGYQEGYVDDQYGHGGYTPGYDMQEPVMPSQVSVMPPQGYY